jgi:hypothetical protein
MPCEVSKQFKQSWLAELENPQDEASDVVMLASRTNKCLD